MDVGGNLEAEFLVTAAGNGRWQLVEFAIGLPETICESLAARS